MKTIYIRNVPDDVVDRLTQLSHAEGMSVSAYAAKGLADLSARESNRHAFAAMTALSDVTLEEIVGDVERSRAQR